ncbi:response regulator [Roseibium sp.]|uniref:response regulator n=2 Tax=Alphaproteobacteria TaxID=28211 RepID=UPI0032678988
MTRKVSVLFVDDEPNILSAVRRHVRRYRDEWDLHFAQGGVEAVRVITCETVDIIVTDMKMPEVDGTRLLEWISEHHPKIIRFVLSGEAKPDEIYRIVGRSHRFLAKPCSPEAIVAGIRDVVDAQLHDQLENGAVEMSMLDRLGTPPGIVTELQAHLEQEEPCLDRIADIVRKDPSLSLRMLQLCNSAYFKQPFPTCSIRKAVSHVGADRLRELLEAGRLGQQSRANSGENAAVTEAHCLARATMDACAELTQKPDSLSAAYVVGLGLRCSAVDASGTLAQAALRAAFLTVLLGLPEILKKTLLGLAETNAQAPQEHWPKLIAGAIAAQEFQTLSSEAVT